jgi:hypothetical protein
VKRIFFIFLLVFSSPTFAAVGPEIIQRQQQQEIEAQMRAAQMQSIAAQSPYAPGGALAGLNRDVNASQEVTKDMITGALDGSVTVDNRIFSESGRAQIADQHEHFVDNAIIAGTGAIGTVVETATSIYDAMTTDEAGLVDTWSAYQKAKVYGITGATNEVVQDLREKQNSGEILTPEDLQLLSKLTHGEEVNKVYSDGRNEEIHGFYDTVNKQGYIDVSNVGTDQREFFLTDAEESAHRFTNNEVIAGNAANTELGYYDFVSWATGGNGISDNNSTNQSSWNNTYNNSTSDLLYNNSVQASLVDDADKLYRMAAPVFRPMPNMTTGSYRRTQNYNIGGARIGSGPVNFEDLAFEQQLAVRANETAIRDAKAKGLEPETFMTAEGSPAPPLSFKHAPNANGTTPRNNEPANLKYEGASYHHKNSSGLKSKAPSNPQDALDRSVQITENSPRRIGVDPKTGEINIFDSSNNGKYHGHTRLWNELHQHQKNALIESGQATRKGSIIP